MPIEVRRERVRRGSRRRRDLEAVRVDNERQAAEAMADAPARDEDAALWDSALRRAMAMVPEANANLWLRPLRFVGATEETLYLAAPPGIGPWVQRRYCELLLEAAAKVGAGWTRIEFVGETG